MLTLCLLLGLICSATAQTLLGKIGPWDGGGDQFGWSLSLSGDLLAVGSPIRNYFQGAVYIFKCNFNSSMVPCDPFAKLTPPQNIRSHFGYSLALEGSILVVGAPQQNEFSGASYVYTCAGSGCSLISSLTSPLGPEQGDFFGQAVAISRERVVIGEYLRPGGGVAYTYHCPNGRCTYQSELSPDDLVNGDYFGNTVAFGGEIVAVGATAQDEFHGAVYCFKCDAVARCSQWAKLVPFNALPNGWFGSSINIWGESMVIGAHHERDMRGTAYVFNCHNQTCHEFDKLWHSDSSTDDAFGNAVAMQGEYVAIGSPSQSDEQGSLYVYHCGTVLCVETLKIKAPDGNPGDFFGSSLFYTSNNLLYVGAHGEAAVYVYSLVF